MSELKELSRLVITTRDARMLENKLIGCREPWTWRWESYEWRLYLEEDSFGFWFYFACSDVWGGRSQPWMFLRHRLPLFFFPLVDLRDNHFFWSCPNQLGRLARALLLSTSPVLGLQTYTTTTSDFLFKIWILGTKLRKALYQQSCLCSPALFFF